MIKSLPKSECEVKHSICEYHRKHPEDKSYAGCLCSSSYVLKRKEVRE